MTDDHDQRYAEVRALADLLDSRFRIPFTQQRFGVDAIVGLIPGVGDVAGLVASSLVVAEAVRLGARGWTLASMLLRITLDALVGTVPVVGTVFDVVYKASQRNVALLERHTLDAAGARDEARRSVVRSLAVVASVTVLASVVVVLGLVLLLQWVL